MTNYLPIHVTGIKDEQKKARELTGRPTATLNKEILLIPSVNLMFWLNVNLGFDNPP